MRQQRQYRSDFIVNIGISYDAGRKEPARRDELSENAFVTAQQTQQSSVGIAYANMAARAAAGRPDIEPILRKQQDDVARWQALGAAIRDAASCIGGQCEPGLVATLQAERVAVEQRLERLDAAIAHDLPTWSELGTPAPVTASEARGLLTPGEALLVYVTAPNENLALGGPIRLA